MVEEVIKYISEYQNISEESLSANTRLVDDVGLESMDLLQMCAAFEDMYGIEFPIDDIYDFATINDIAIFLEEKGI